MIYKNMEIHNVAELYENGGGVSWLRMPADVDKQLEIVPVATNACRNSTGVELRFVMKSDKVRLCLEAIKPGVFHVFRGGLQGGWEDHEVDKIIDTRKCFFEIKRSENLPMLKRMSAVSGTDWDPEVVRVIFDRGTFILHDIEGDIIPPSKNQKPAKTLMCYGSSITHGSNSFNTSSNWSAVVAHNLNMDCRNLGMPGSCAMEPAVIEYIAAEGENGNWDMITLCLGINVLDWDNEKIFTRVTNTIREVAGRNANKPVFIISPFYSNDDFDKKGRADNWRKIIAEIVAKENFDNVTYINGLDLLGDMSLISADEVHPNIYGIQQIADILTAVMKSKM